MTPRLGWTRGAVAWCVAAPLLVLLPAGWRALAPATWPGFEEVGHALPVLAAFGLALLLGRTLGVGRAGR